MSDVLKNHAEVSGTIGKLLHVDCISAVFSAEVATKLVESRTAHKLGWHVPTKQMNFLQSEGRAKSPVCKNFCKV